MTPIAMREAETPTFTNWFHVVIPQDRPAATVAAAGASPSSSSIEHRRPQSGPALPADDDLTWVARASELLDALTDILAVDAIPRRRLRRSR